MFSSICSTSPIQLLIIILFSSIFFCFSFSLLLIFNNHRLIEIDWIERGDKMKRNEMNRPKDVVVLGLSSFSNETVCTFQFIFIKCHSKRWAIIIFINIFSFRFLSHSRHSIWSSKVSLSNTLLSQIAIVDLSSFPVRLIYIFPCDKMKFCEMWHAHICQLVDINK